MANRVYDYQVNPSAENVVIQVFTDDGWLDYSRCTIAQARRHVDVNGPDKFRMVDWIWKDLIQ